MGVGMVSLMGVSTTIEMDWCKEEGRGSWSSRSVVVVRCGNGMGRALLVRGRRVIVRRDKRKRCDWMVVWCLMLALQNRQWWKRGVSKMMAVRSNAREGQERMILSHRIRIRLIYHQRACKAGIEQSRGQGRETARKAADVSLAGREDA